ncbi:MAG: RNA methyltransferase [Candidatus Anstonellales archaeon]
MLKKLLRVVLVEPEHQINIGHCARAMKNFGFYELYLVRPRCEIGLEARKYAKHALDVLENARIVAKLEEAVAGCDSVVGTTGILRRHKHIIRQPISLKEFSKMKRQGKMAVLFGRESIGLKESEIELCEMMIHVPTHHIYPVMNVSHAVAIVLYELSKLRLEKRAELATYKEREQAVKFFEKMAIEGGLNNPQKTACAFRRVLGRAQPTKIENACILGVFRRVINKCGGAC